MAIPLGRTYRFVMSFESPGRVTVIGFQSNVHLIRRRFQRRRDGQATAAEAANLRRLHSRSVVNLFVH